jgi:hypothetical protein
MQRKSTEEDQDELAFDTVIDPGDVHLTILQSPSVVTESCPL